MTVEHRPRWNDNLDGWENCERVVAEASVRLTRNRATLAAVKTPNVTRSDCRANPTMKDTICKALLVSYPDEKIYVRRTVAVTRVTREICSTFF